MPSATHSTHAPGPSDPGVNTNPPSIMSLSSDGRDDTAKPEACSLASGTCADTQDPLEALRNRVQNDARAYIKRTYDQASSVDFDKSLANAPSTLYQDYMVEWFAVDSCIDHSGEDVPSFASQLSDAERICNARAYAQVLRDAKSETTDPPWAIQYEVLNGAKELLEREPLRSYLRQSLASRNSLVQGELARSGNADNQSTSASSPDTDPRNSSELEALRTRLEDKAARYIQRTYGDTDARSLKAALASAPSNLHKDFALEDLAFLLANAANDFNKPTFDSRLYYALGTAETRADLLDMGFDRKDLIERTGWAWDSEEALSRADQYLKRLQGSPLTREPESVTPTRSTGWVEWAADRLPSVFRCA